MNRGEMQNREQSEAILDLYEACIASWWAWEQQEASERAYEAEREANGSQEDKAYVQEACWVEALERITKYYNLALAAGCPEEYAMFVLFDNLPYQVADSISIIDSKE